MYKPKYIIGIDPAKDNLEKCNLTFSQGGQIFTKEVLHKCMIPKWKFWVRSLMFWKYRIIVINGETTALLKN